MRIPSSILLLAALGLMSARLRAEGNPAEVPVPDAPVPVAESDFAVLRSASPFRRVLDPAATFALRGVAVFDDRQWATLYNRETKKTHVIDREKANEEGLQLIDDGMAPEDAQAVRRNLGLIAYGKRREAAAALGLTPVALDALAARISRLSPDPAAAYAAGLGLAAAAALVPELAVETGSDGRPRLRLLEDPAAAVTVDDALAERALRGGDDAARAFVAAQRGAARDLVSALGFRRRTLLRVGEALVEAQSAYFLGGARAPAPLRRADLAGTLGLHPSTVGRTVRGRALLFRGEVRPLASFFSPALAAGAQAALSAIEIQARIREMIGAEAPERPLSDASLAAALQESGVDIARRTVAKYRQGLHIPPSSRRRRQALAARGGGR